MMYFTLLLIPKIDLLQITWQRMYNFVASARQSFAGTLCLLLSASF